MEFEVCQNREKSKEELAEIEAQETLQVLRKGKTASGIVLSGVVRDGKVILDQESLDKIARENPQGNLRFVAVNAPFDPQPLELVGALN